MKSTKNIRTRKNLSPEDYQAIQDDYNKIYQIFEDEHGYITHLHICEDYKNAAVLTAKSGYFSEFSLGDTPMIEEPLIKMDYLASETDRLLRGREKKKCSEMIYSSAKKTLILLDMLNAQKANQDDVKKTVKIVNKQLEFVEKYH